MSLLKFVPLLVLLASAGASAQRPAAEVSYSRLNTFSGFVEYANDSSHIILGQAKNRKIGALGFQYARRLVHQRLLDLSYTAELRPGMLESDPTASQLVVVTAPFPASYQDAPVSVDRCVPGSSQIHAGDYSATYVITCGRRTVVEQGFSPAGLRMNLLPGRRIQPSFSTFAGYMFSSQEVPVSQAGSFNFTFEFGAGVEVFLRKSARRSMRLEYQVQHFSDKNTSYSNPGVDSGFVKLTYAFGR